MRPERLRRDQDAENEDAAGDSPAGRELADIIPRMTSERAASIMWESGLTSATVLNQPLISARENALDRNNEMKISESSCDFVGPLLRPIAIEMAPTPAPHHGDHRDADHAEEAALDPETERPRSRRRRTLGRRRVKACAGDPAHQDRGARHRRCCRGGRRNHLRCRWPYHPGGDRAEQAPWMMVVATANCRKGHRREPRQLDRLASAAELRQIEEGQRRDDRDRLPDRVDDRAFA